MRPSRGRYQLAAVAVTVAVRTFVQRTLSAIQSDTNNALFELKNLAEGEGFEPPKGFRPSGFKAP